MQRLRTVTSLDVSAVAGHHAMPAALLFFTLIAGQKIAEFAHSIDLDEVAHNEPPHLDLHCLPSSL